MFLHIGANASIRSKDIVAIIDMRSGADSAVTREFLELSQSEASLVDVSEKDPRSFVLTRDKTYLSPISADTLARRAEERI